MVVPARTARLAFWEAMIYSFAKCNKSDTILLPLPLPLLLLLFFMDSGRFALTVCTIMSNAAAYSGDNSVIVVGVVEVVVVMGVVVEYKLVVVDDDDDDGVEAARKWLLL